VRPLTLALSCSALCNIAHVNGDCLMTFYQSHCYDVYLNHDLVSQYRLSDEVDKSPSLAQAVTRRMHLPDLPASAACLFPHAVLEIKLAAAAPEWVTTLLAKWSSSLVPIYKFSKFLSSIALFHQPRVQCIPHWFKDDGSLDVDLDAARLTIATSQAEDGGSVNKSVQALVPRAATNGRASRLTSSSSAFASSLSTGSECDDEAKSKPDGEVSRRAVAEVVEGSLSGTRMSSPGNTMIELAALQANPLYAGVASTPARSSTDSVTSDVSRAGGSTGTAKSKTIEPGSGVTVASTFIPQSAQDVLVAQTTFCGDGLWASVPCAWVCCCCREVKPDTKRFVPVRVEPKSFFANERTYLKWVMASMFVFGLAMAFVATETVGGINAGIVITTIAFLVLVYGFVVFNLRAQVV
jgi:hypothetical protein